MFKISFFCDDKKLPNVLRELTGVALGAPEVLPVVNGAVHNGKVTGANDGEISSLFADFVKQNKLTELGNVEVKAFAKSMGRNESSYTWYIKRLLRAGLIKKKGKGRYSVAVPK